MLVFQDKKQLPRATITTVTDTHSTKDDGMFVPFGDAGDVVADAVPAPNETLKAPKANKKEMAAERRKEQWLKRLSEEQVCVLLTWCRALLAS